MGDSGQIVVRMTVLDYERAALLFKSYDVHILVESHMLLVENVLSYPKLCTYGLHLQAKWICHPDRFRVILLYSLR